MNHQKRLAKIERKLLHLVGRAIEEHRLIEEGDHILVAVSGGKDSWSLLHLLERLRQKAPISFSLLALHLDQSAPDSPASEIQAALAARALPYRVEQRRIYPLVLEKLSPGSNPCALCSRLRRGALYQLAPQLGCNKIALGHHLDDLIETLLLNLFFNGMIASMPPRLTSDDGRNIVIRPLCYVEEEQLRTFSQLQGFPLFSCGTCIDNEQQSRRQQIKEWIAQLQPTIPGLKQSLLRSLSNVRPSQLFPPAS